MRAVPDRHISKQFYCNPHPHHMLFSSLISTVMTLIFS